jgi:hypothetical protein
LKIWLFSILGLGIFIMLSCLNQASLENQTHHLSIKLYQVEKAIQSRQWHEAGREIESIQTDWRKIKPTWSLLLHHREIDAIDQALIRTLKAIQSHDDSTARIEQGCLVKYIEHIPKREEFSLVNIL